eukprot:356531-Pleurochrysis_carterae.AAC.1
MRLRCAAHLEAARWGNAVGDLIWIHGTPQSVKKITHTIARAHSESKTIEKEVPRAPSAGGWAAPATPTPGSRWLL